MAHVAHLLIKPAHKAVLQNVTQMHVSTDGIAGQVATPPLRQVLLLEERTLQEFNLRPGDLRENVIVRDMDLYSLPSGTVLQIGTAKIALTFHCEPCKIIANKVNLKDIRAQRGYLGRFLNEGILQVGDSVSVVPETVEFIPDEPVERIIWCLNRIDGTITASDLMWQAGLASSYCRALPAMLRKHPEMNAGKILFLNKK